MNVLGYFMAWALFVFLANHGGELAELVMQWLRQAVGA